MVSKGSTITRGGPPAGAADLLDTLSDAVVAHEDAGPHGLHDPVPVHEISRILDEMTQQREGFRAKAAFPPVGEQSAADEIQDEVVEPINRLGQLGTHGVTTRGKSDGEINEISADFHLAVET